MAKLSHLVGLEVTTTRTRFDCSVMHNKLGDHGRVGMQTVGIFGPIFSSQQISCSLARLMPTPWAANALVSALWLSLALTQ